MGRNDDFYFGVNVKETEKRLFQTRDKVRKSTALKPGDMDADDVDYEMQFEKNTEELDIFGMNQSGLERFAEKYGSTYRRLHFFQCQYISDFTPLEDLKNLEMVGIAWNLRAQKLWDTSKNPALWSFLCQDAKKLTCFPVGLQAAKNLKNVMISGPLNEGTHTMQSLECFADMPALEKLIIRFMKLEDHSTAFLDALPLLRQFDFDAGMFTTEEIDQIAAKYPALQGEYICACNEALWGMRVSGYRKPTLSLPKDQKRLDRYCAEFQTLVEKYKAELKSRSN